VREKSKVALLEGIQIVREQVAYGRSAWIRIGFSPSLTQGRRSKTGARTTTNTVHTARWTNRRRANLWPFATNPNRSKYDETFRAHSYDFEENYGRQVGYLSRCKFVIPESAKWHGREGFNPGVGHGDHSYKIHEGPFPELVYLFERQAFR